MIRQSSFAQDTARPISAQENRGNRGVWAFCLDMNDYFGRDGIRRVVRIRYVISPGRVYSTNYHCHSTNLVDNPKLVNKGVRGGRGEGIGCVPMCAFKQGCQNFFAVFASLLLSI